MYHPAKSMKIFFEVGTPNQIRNCESFLLYLDILISLWPIELAHFSLTTFQVNF